jgi:hypothetical protein
MAYRVQDRFGRPASVCRVTENLLNRKLVRDRSGPVRMSRKRPPKRSFTIFRVPIRSPNMVALAERFVQTIKQECLDHFAVFGSTHRDVLCQEFNVHYHEERPHQGLGNELVIRDRRNARNPKRNHQKRIRFRFLRFVAKNGAADYSRGTVAKRRNSRRRSPFRVGFISDLSALLRVTRTSVRNDAC